MGRGKKRASPTKASSRRQQRRRPTPSTDTAGNDKNETQLAGAATTSSLYKLVHPIDVSFLTSKFEFFVTEHDDENNIMGRPLIKGGYTIIDVDGDGNCGYYSVLMGLYDVGKASEIVTDDDETRTFQKSDMITLRKMIFDFMLSNNNII
jgi:hypothetical protein